MGAPVEPHVGPWKKAGCLAAGSRTAGSPSSSETHASISAKLHYKESLGVEKRKTTPRKIQGKDMQGDVTQRRGDKDGTGREAQLTDCTRPASAGAKEVVRAR